MQKHAFRSNSFPKCLAKDLHRALLDEGAQSSLSQAQADVARALGHASWHAMTAACTPAGATAHRDGLMAEIRGGLVEALAPRVGGAAHAALVLERVAAVAREAPAPRLTLFACVEKFVRKVHERGRFGLDGVAARTAWIAYDPDGGLSAALRLDETLDDDAFAGAVKAFIDREHGVPEGAKERKPALGFMGYAIVHVDDAGVHMVGSAANGEECGRLIALGADGRLGPAVPEVGKAVFRGLDSAVRPKAKPLAVADFFRHMEGMARSVMAGVAGRADPDERLWLHGALLEDASRSRIAMLTFDKDKDDAGNAAWMRSLLDERGAPAACVFFGASGLDPETGAPAEGGRMVVVAGCAIDGTYVHQAFPVDAKGRFGEPVEIAAFVSPYCGLYRREPRRTLETDGRMRA